MRLITKKQETELMKSGVIRLMTRFKGKAKTTLSGKQMAEKVYSEGNKLLKQIDPTDKKEQ